MAEYGAWALLVSILALSPVLQFGLATAVSYQIAQDTEGFSDSVRTSFVLFLVMGSAVAVVLYLLGPFIGAWLSEEGDRAGSMFAVRLIGVAALMQFMRQWAMSIEAGLQRYDLQVWAEGLGALATNAGLVGLVILGYKTSALAAWMAATGSLTLLVHWLLLRNNAALPFGSGRLWSRSHAARLLSYGWRQWIAQLASTVFTQADKIVVGIALGTSAAGLYSAATTVASRINELSAAPLQVIVPAIAQSRAKDNPARTKEVFLKAQHANVILSLALTVAVMLLARPLSIVLVPEGSASIVEGMLRTVAAAYGLFSINAAGYFGAQGIGRPMINAKWGLFSGAMFFLMLLAAVAWGGLGEAAWANFGYAVVLGTNVEVGRYIGIPAWKMLRIQGGHLLSVVIVLALSAHVLTYPGTVVGKAAVTVGGAFAAAIWIAHRLKSSGILGDVAWSDRNRRSGVPVGAGEGHSSPC